MIIDLLTAIWFLLPAAAANAAPVFAAKLPLVKRWDAPIDGGHMVGGQALFGPHKTWRGMVSGIIVATLLLYVQQLLVVHTELIPFIHIDYAALPVLLLGPAFAIGALGGDLVESFFKRRVGIASGKSWLFFDQIDYVVGSILASLFFVILTPMQYVWMVIVWFTMHLVISYIGYRLGLKDEPI
jgi:CDP-2,3-bis-(O-geranylgeranyl)-sn-glycerol synthase